MVFVDEITLVSLAVESRALFKSYVMVTKEHGSLDWSYGMCYCKSCLWFLRLVRIRVSACAQMVNDSGRGSGEGFQRCNNVSECCSVSVSGVVEVKGYIVPGVGGSSMSASGVVIGSQGPRDCQGWS